MRTTFSTGKPWMVWNGWKLAAFGLGLLAWIAVLYAVEWLAAALERSTR